MFTEGQRVEIRRGNDKGRTGSVYAVHGDRYVIGIDDDGRYGASAILSARSLKALAEAAPAVCNVEPASVADEAPAEVAQVETPAEAKHSTREAWLVEAVELLRPLFAEVGEEIPTVRVSVGWPGGRGKKNSVIGQCWASWTATDKVSQLFISPVLADAGVVLATLAHEVVHAVDDCASGHKGRFAKVAKGIGLEGKMTATHAGEALKVKLAGIGEALGAYPHAKLAEPGRDGQGEKKQATRLLKVECGDCGYTARVTKKWLDLHGAPICPCNREQMSEA